MFGANSICVLHLWLLYAGIILGMGSAIERRRYFVTSPLIGCAQARPIYVFDVRMIFCFYYE